MLLDSFLPITLLNDLLLPGRDGAEQSGAVTLVLAEQSCYTLEHRNPAVTASLRKPSPAGAELLYWGNLRPSEE